MVKASVDCFSPKTTPILKSSQQFVKNTSLKFDNDPEEMPQAATEELKPAAAICACK